MSDWQLLRQYIDDGSDTAFTQLVDRHKKLVYWTCRRDIGDMQLAEDAAQAVFITLARKASTIRKDASLAGWLFSVARHVSKRVRDSEQRRRRNEERAALHMQSEVNMNTAWEQVEPWLNDALTSLSGQDRTVVLLRFCEGYSFPEIAGTLGTTEEAARKRVTRSLERLRSYLGRKDVSIASAILAALLAERAANAVPDTCAIISGKAILAAASAGSAHIANAHTGSLLIKKGAIILMDATIKKAAITAGIILLAGGGLAITAVNHRAHASQVRTRPPTRRVASDPPLSWVSPPAADAATRKTEQRIQAQLGRFLHGFNSRNSSEITAAMTRNCVFTSPYETKPIYAYDDLARADSFTHIAPDANIKLRVNSCQIKGNTALVGLYLFRHGTNRGNLSDNGPIVYYDSEDVCVMTFSNIGGQWLITRNEEMSQKRLPYHYHGVK